ncbi:hypothetical protein [uncultured Corynebacterium sp.]|uniref:hypothetical protein n=1 Tax=uncultured Corynebacterium sp. TaxID=159447 RepID=UPI0025CCAAB7|nr:hypothetical protein [uncultured Corynebacterium sp.]
MNLHASHASPLLDRAMALVMAGLATFGGLTACSSNSPALANQQATNSPSATQDRVYLRVPESTSVIQMKEHEPIATIDVAKPSGH